MKIIKSIFLVISIISMFSALNLCAAGNESSPPDLNCEAGPLPKTFGKTPWLIYGCDDKQSIIILSDTGNPAMPFYFMVYIDAKGELQIHGEGTGKNSATRAAFAEIKLLTVQDVASLNKESQAIVK